jgi:hypothetical protein
MVLCLLLLSTSRVRYTMASEWICGMCPLVGHKKNMTLFKYMSDNVYADASLDTNVRISNIMQCSRPIVGIQFLMMYC